MSYGYGWEYALGARQNLNKGSPYGPFKTLIEIPSTTCYFREMCVAFIVVLYLLMAVSNVTLDPTDTCLSISTKWSDHGIQRLRAQINVSNLSKSLYK